MKSDLEEQFEAWFKRQPFYMQELCKHGERLFIKDGDDYKFAAVRTAFAAWSFWHDLLIKQAERWEDNSKMVQVLCKLEGDSFHYFAVKLSNLARSGGELQ